MKKYFVLCAMICLLGACISDPVITPSDTVDGGYLKKAMETPLTFSVDKEKAEEVWSRVNVFIAKYASLKIQVSTQYSIETFTPSQLSGFDMMSGNVQFGYSATRMIKGDKHEITVNCHAPSMKNATDRNAHLLAYYALTGEVIERYIKR